ncbi:hypothetical protein Pyn_30029 [Prunus yedoensis var. nudiflora]|uniref:Uncharacterized protein n=1 Tax=Prunus yedoensis var. nudiflora TaxID=2094558 RepID=A0A314ZAG2_PRUYE|nr:hypothetical protein Pyn_30029 [Prunus yedoensis var. nudiflora]
MQAKPSHAEKPAPQAEGLLEYSRERCRKMKKREAKVGSSEEPGGEDKPDSEGRKGRTES